MKLIGISMNLRLVKVAKEYNWISKKKWKGNGEFLCISFINL